MAQLKSEKADLTKETADFRYQKLDLSKKLKTEVLLHWNINVKLLNRKCSLVNCTSSICRFCFKNLINLATPCLFFVNLQRLTLTGGQ